MALILLIWLLFNQVTENITKYFFSVHKGADIEISKINIPDGLEEVKIREGEQVKTGRNVTYIPIQGKKYNKVVNSFAEVKFKEYTEALIAENDIPAKKVFDKSMFSIKRIEKGNGVRKMIYPSEVENFRSKLNIRKGSIIYSDITEPIPAVKQGDKVSAVLVKGIITIEIDAIAKKDGMISEMISIVSTDGKQYKARVINSNSVEIIK